MCQQGSYFSIPSVSTKLSIHAPFSTFLARTEWIAGSLLKPKTPNQQLILVPDLFLSTWHEECS